MPSSTMMPLSSGRPPPGGTLCASGRSLLRRARVEKPLRGDHILVINSTRAGRGRNAQTRGDVDCIGSFEVIDTGGEIV